jgi:hypothetical protein
MGLPRIIDAIKPEGTGIPSALVRAGVAAEDRHRDASVTSVPMGK